MIWQSGDISQQLEIIWIYRVRVFSPCSDSSPAQCEISPLVSYFGEVRTHISFWKSHDHQKKRVWLFYLLFVVFVFGSASDKVVWTIFDLCHSQIRHKSSLSPRGSLLYLFGGGWSAAWCFLVDRRGYDFLTTLVKPMLVTSLTELLS